MSPSTGHHLTTRQLQAWQAGTLTESAAAAVEAHLIACDKCAALLDSMPDESKDVWESLRRSTFTDAVSVRGLRPAADADQRFDNGDTLEEPGRTDSLTIRDFDGKGRWQLDHRIAQGGIGEIWLADDLLLHRKVVVKRLRPDRAGSQTVQRRFLREARVTAGLMHPGIVYVHDLTEDGHSSYYVMSLVEGRSLTELIGLFHQHREGNEDGSHRELVQLIQHLMAVSHTIHYAHCQGILHRDIKSENVIVGNFGQVVLIDWGLAKRMDQAESAADEPITDHEIQQMPKLTASGISGTQPGARLGTPAFMAPEQARGDSPAVGICSDIYGLAAVLYEILTGRPPFIGESVDEVLEAAASQSPERPGRLNPDVPGRLEEICMKGLAASPADRQQSADDFCRELESWVAKLSEQQRSQQARDRFFELSRDLLGILDSEGTITQVNPACERVLGWKPEQVIGRKDVELVHSDYFREVPEVRRQLLESGGAEEGLIRRVRASDGSFRWLQWYVTAITEEQSLYIVGRDITEQKKLLHRLEALLQAMPDCVIVTDRTGHMEVVNAAVTRLTGYQRDELLGERIFMLVADRSMEEYRRTVTRILVDKRYQEAQQRYSVWGRPKSGPEFEVEVRHSALQLEDELLFIAAIRPLHQQQSIPERGPI